MKKFTSRILASLLSAALLFSGFSIPASAANPTVVRSVSPMAASPTPNWSKSTSGTQILANWTAVTGTGITYTVSLYRNSSLVTTVSAVMGISCDFTSYIINSPGIYTFTVQPSDGSASMSSTPFVEFNGLYLTSSSGSYTTVSSSTTPTFTASLPIGTTLSGGTVTLYEGNNTVGTGTVSGSLLTVTASSLSAGSHSVYAVVSNGSNLAGISNTVSVTMDTTAVAITTASLPDAGTSSYYSQQLLPTSTASSSTLYWSLFSGYLPYGLYLSNTGLIYGTPTTPGSYTFTVQATSIGGLTATKTLTMNVLTIPVIQTSALPNGNTGTAYSYTLAASANATWAVSSGTLPAGLTLSAAGVLSGTPTTAGTYTFYVTAKNASSTSSGTTSSGTSGSTTPVSTQMFTMTITSIPIITTATLQDGKQNTSYSQTIAASNTPTSWSMISGSLPDGLSFDTKTAAISGTPTKVGVYTFSIVAANATGSSDVKQFTINIYGIPSITTTSLPNASVGSNYNLRISSVNAPTAWSIITGSMPAGMTLGAATGVISGIPTTAGVYAFSVMATNSAGTSTVQPLVIVVTGGTAPGNVTVNGSGDATNATATIQAANTKPAAVSTVTVKLTGATVTSPASALNTLIGNNDANTLQLALLGNVTASADIATAAKKQGLTPVSSVELDLTRHNADGSKDTIQQLGGSSTVSINLTDAQATQLKGMVNPCLLYYDANTKALTKLNGTVSLSGKTVTVATSHLGTFVVAAKVLTVNLGVSYKTYVGKKGWQSYKKNGATSGDLKNTVLTALNVKLIGNPPAGIGVSYQTYLHGRGWQKAAANGATSGSTNSALYLEALRVTVNGIGSYRVSYRVYLQNKGWQAWKNTNGGTAVSSAAISGTPGKGYKVSAVQIKLTKIA